MFDFCYIEMIISNSITTNIFTLKNIQQPYKNVSFYGLNSISKDTFE